MAIKTLTAELARMRFVIIMVFGDGAPDKALKEIHSKELVGVHCGGYEVCTTLEKLQFIVVSQSKDHIERFGHLDEARDKVKHIPKKHPFKAREAVKRRGVGSKKKTSKGGAKLSTKDKWKREEAGECAVTCVSVLVYHVHSILAHRLLTDGALCRIIYRHHSLRSRAQIRNKDKLQFQTGG